MQRPRLEGHATSAAPQFRWHNPAESDEKFPRGTPVVAVVLNFAIRQMKS
jgi:hypothetical protein